MAKEVLNEANEAEYRRKYEKVPTPGAHNYMGGKIPENEALDNGFYGHYLPEHFKKTSIIDTKVER